MKNYKGITLITLVITIIVLLLLAGISLSLTLGNSGILQKTTNAKEKSEAARELESIKLAVSAAQIAGKGILTTNELNYELQTEFNNNKVVSNSSSGWKYETKKTYQISKDGKVTEGLLPEEYQQIEYIQSSGKEYINTYFKANQNTRVVCDCLISDGMKSGYYQALFGATEYINKQEINRTVLHLHLPPQGVMACFGKNLNVSVAFKEFNSRHVYELNKNSFIVDKTKIVDLPNDTFQSNVDLNIFRDNNQYNQDVRYCKMILYNFEIYDNDTLKRKYIPCYSTNNVIDVNNIDCESGTVGLYDTVEGKFYTNQGEGAFLPGVDV